MQSQQATYQAKQLREEEEKLNSINPDGSDLFLELFANDFCRVTHCIKMKRKQRGRDYMYQNKLKAVDMKVQAVQNYYVRSKYSNNTLENAFFSFKK